ncbi:MAG: hypothetical protein WCF44_14990 [Candidatus Methylophosphatis roskildensis]
MLIAGNSLRLTSEEIKQHRGVGLNVEHVRSRGQYARAVEVWALCLAEVRPDILDKFVEDLAQAVAKKHAGNSPPSLTA